MSRRALAPFAPALLLGAIFATGCSGDGIPPERLLKGHEDTIDTVDISADGSRIISGAGDLSVRVWDATTGEELHSIIKQTDDIVALAFYPDGSRFVSASEDGTIIIFETATAKEIKTIAEHKSKVRDVVVTPNGAQIVSVGDDGLCIVTNAADGEFVRKIEAPEVKLRSVVVLPDSNTAVAGSKYGELFVWNLSTGEKINFIEKAHEEEISRIAVSADGKFIATAGEDPAIKIWDTTTWQSTQSVTVHKDEINDVEFSPDGKYLATTAGDSRLHLLDLAKNYEKAELQVKQMRKEAKAIAFSADGLWMVTGGRDDLVKLYHLVAPPAGEK